MKKMLHWTFFLFLLLPSVAFGQVRHSWIPIKTTATQQKVYTVTPTVNAATLADTIYYSAPDSFKAFTGRFGQGTTYGVFFTIPNNFYPVKIKQLIVTFYGGRTDTIGALYTATIQAALWGNVAAPSDVNSDHFFTNSNTQTISVPVDQIRQQAFAFNDTSEISNPQNFGVGIQYIEAPDSIKAVSPVFGYPPNQYDEFYIDSTGSTPVYYDHQSYWTNPDSIGNMSAYLIVDVDTSGTPTGITEEKWHFPDSKGIIANYPNPFNPQTVITVQSPENGRGSIIIYNILGDKVFEKKKFLRKGERYSFSWQPLSNATGIYFVSLHIKNNRYFHKMIYLK